MKQWPILIATIFLPAAVFSTALPAQASRNTCLLQSDLALMQHEMRAFLEYLDTGKDLGQARYLRHWLADHPPVDLRVRMRRAGMGGYEAQTLTLIARHKALLEVHRRKGRRKAAASAQRLGVAALLDDYAGRILPLPCDFAPQKQLAASARTGIGPLKLLPRSAAIASGLLALALGVAGFVAAGYFARRQRRRRKRHPCALPALLRSGPAHLPALFVDISCTGAKLRIWEEMEGDELSKGQAVTAVITGFQPIEAQVSWQNADYTGIKFSSRLTREELNRLLRFSKSKAAPLLEQTEPA